MNLKEKVQSYCLEFIQDFLNKEEDNIKNENFNNYKDLFYIINNYKVKCLNNIYHRNKFRQGNLFDWERVQSFNDIFWKEYGDKFLIINKKN